MSDPKKGLILLVDDEDPLRRAFARALEGAGFEVLQASAGSDALRLLEAQAVDALVSDISMPHMSGLDLLRAIRQRASNVPVILISGDSNGDSASQAVAEGALCCLPKPVPKAALIEAVEQAIKQRRKP